MSYARWSDGSDVYVYATTPRVTFYCVECPRVGRTVAMSGAPAGSAALAMAEHLEQDRAAGFRVPQGAIDRLRAPENATWNHRVDVATALLLLESRTQLLEALLQAGLELVTINDRECRAGKIPAAKALTEGETR